MLPWTNTNWKLNSLECASDKSVMVYLATKKTTENAVGNLQLDELQHPSSQLFVRNENSTDTADGQITGDALTAHV